MLQSVKKHCLINEIDFTNKLEEAIVYHMLLFGIMLHFYIFYKSESQMSIEKYDGNTHMMK